MHHEELDNDEVICVDDEVYTETKRTISMQRDLTTIDITALQFDKQSKQKEVKSSGYPSREQLQADRKLLVLYTGIHNTNSDV